MAVSRRFGQQEMKGIIQGRHGASVIRLEGAGAPRRLRHWVAVDLLGFNLDWIDYDWMAESADGNSGVGEADEGLARRGKGKSWEMKILGQGAMENRARMDWLEENALFAGRAGCVHRWGPGEKGKKPR